MAALSLVAVMSASATLYNVTFTEGFGGLSTLAGTVDVVNGIAISGSITATGPNAGSFTLLTAHTYPPYTTTPSGTIGFDNIVYPANPRLDIWGLGFIGGTGGTSEMNLYWDASSGTYSLVGWIAGQGYVPNAVSGAASVTAVPEPTTVIAGALLLLPFGASTIRVLRKNLTA